MKIKLELLEVFWFNKELIERLTSKNEKDACDFACVIIEESQKSNIWFKYFADFISLLDHKSSYVRNRIIYIIAANVKWDENNQFDEVLSDFLSHITDEKPITARQCVKSLVEIGESKPQYISAIISSLKDADLSKYKDSMRPLIEKDISTTIKILGKVDS